MKNRTAIIQDITFASVLSELKSYRPDYNLTTQIDQYEKLLLQTERYSKTPERVIVRRNLLNLIKKINLN